MDAASTPFSDEPLSDYFEQAPIALHLVAPDGTILRANKAELDMLGYASDEYIGRNVAEFHADPPVISDMLYRLTNGETLQNFEARLKCKNGELRHVLISSNVRRENGQFVHTRCFTRDVTDRKAAEQARAEAAAMARLAAQLQNAREDERRRLARQLHDELIAGLTAAAIDLHNVQVQLAARGDPLARNVQMVMRLLSGSVDAKRRIIESLRPTMLHELGLGAALAQMAQRFTAKTGILCATEIDPRLTIDEELGLILYRIAQEALDNVAERSGTTRATIRLINEEHRAVLVVNEDRDGSATAPHTERPPDIQLQGCRQLLAGWGGTLSLRTRPDGGAEVHAVAPLTGALAPH